MDFRARGFRTAGVCITHSLFIRLHLENSVSFKWLMANGTYLLHFPLVGIAELSGKNIHLALLAAHARQALGPEGVGFIASDSMLFF